nr:Gfo/Idh/MocA family oxidoreductase [Vibrio sonorensis]
MIKLAVIGTNWITAQFVDAALETERYQLKAVYSRKKETAKAFANKYSSSIVLFDDLTLLSQDQGIDAVYIASPNSFHAPQAIELMKAGKHVICEKPVAANATLAKEMYDVAKQNGVYLFEAFMSPHLPNFSVLKSALGKIGSLRKATISYCQYSSRYPKYLAGENPNTFNPAFANGSMMDIGFYCLGAAVELFGRPQEVKATASMLESGVDGNGSVILQYTDFEVVLNHSKTSDSFIPSEFQGEKGVIEVDMISICNRVWKVTREEKCELSVAQRDNRMYYEAQFFADQLSAKQREQDCEKRSLIVAEVLTEIRRQMG